MHFPVHFADKGPVLVCFAITKNSLLTNDKEKRFV
jgi:hypothetical protein